MRYTAAALTQAPRPVVLTIGRASSRRGARWLSSWWLRVARTFTARPISTPQMLALQAASRDPFAYVATLSDVLRAVFVRRWWYVVTGDPVRLVVGLPDSLRTVVLQRLVTIPGTDRDVSRETDDDLVERIRAEQRRAVYGTKQSTRPAPTLASAAMTVRAAFGDAWYYDPTRWPTSDGYVPFALAWLEFVGVQALDARRRLVVADGYSLAHAKDARRARRALERAAYPSDQVH